MTWKGDRVKEKGTGDKGRGQVTWNGDGSRRREQVTLERVKEKETKDTQRR